MRALHEVALTLLGQLHASFDVSHIEGYGLDSDLEVGNLARPSIRLIPGDSEAAPLTLTFTTFPGLRVRAGRWCTAAFPACGCDAFNENADDEAARLAQMIDDVVAGRFRERIVLPPVGDGSQEWALLVVATASRPRVVLQIDRERARVMPAELRRIPRSTGRPGPGGTHGGRHRRHVDPFR